MSKNISIIIFFDNYNLLIHALLQIKYRNAFSVK